MKTPGRVARSCTCTLRLAAAFRLSAKTASRLTTSACLLFFTAPQIFLILVPIIITIMNKASLHSFNGFAICAVALPNPHSATVTDVKWQVLPKIPCGCFRTPSRPHRSSPPGLHLLLLCSGQAWCPPPRWTWASSPATSSSRSATRGRQLGATFSQPSVGNRLPSSRARHWGFNALALCALLDQTCLCACAGATACFATHGQPWARPACPSPVQVITVFLGSFIAGTFANQLDQFIDNPGV